MMRQTPQIEILKTLFPEFEKIVAFAQGIPPQFYNDPCVKKIKKIIEKMVLNIDVYHYDTMEKFVEIGLAELTKNVRLAKIAAKRFKKIQKAKKEPCAICLELECEVELKECKHMFHLMCLNNLTANDIYKCPLCRCYFREGVELETWTPVQYNRPQEPFPIYDDEVEFGVFVDIERMGRILGYNEDQIDNMPLNRLIREYEEAMAEQAEIDERDFEEGR